MNPQASSLSQHVATQAPAAATLTEKKKLSVRYQSNSSQNFMPTPIAWDVCLKCRFLSPLKCDSESKVLRPNLENAGIKEC